MADDAHSGIGGEHALQAHGRFWRAVSHDDHAGVLRETNAHSAAVVE
jgi:hypothetical protein